MPALIFLILHPGGGEKGLKGRKDQQVHEHEHMHDPRFPSPSAALYNQTCLGEIRSRVLPRAGIDRDVLLPLLVDMRMSGNWVASRAVCAPLAMSAPASSSRANGANGLGSGLFHILKGFQPGFVVTRLTTPGAGLTHELLTTTGGRV